MSNPNEPVDPVDVAARAFDGLGTGDLSGFAPSYTHVTFDFDGRLKVFEGLASFLAYLNQAFETFDLYENNLLRTRAVGAEIVVAEIGSVRRVTGGVEYRGTHVMVFRVEHGRLARGMDMSDAAGEAFWTGLGT